MSSTPSERLVWVYKDGRGFRHEVYIMYHGTASNNVKSILQNGFRVSSGGMLGPGVYASRDMAKTHAYGDTTLKLIVYIGKVQKVNTTQGPETTAWQTDYDTAWVPRGIVNSGRQENCVKDPRRIEILGVCRGFELLSADVQIMTRDYSSKTNSSTTQYDRAERHLLQSLLAKFKLDNETPLKPVARNFGAGSGANANPPQKRGQRGNRSVFQKRTGSGFDQRVFVMYTGTSVANAKAYAENGPQTTDLPAVLGEGIYVTRKIDEAKKQGRVTLKLLAYPGFARGVKSVDDPKKTKWHEDFTSAWIGAANIGIVAGSFSDEINCIASKQHVRVLGICPGGGDSFPAHLLCDSPNGLSQKERKVLDEMVVTNGLKYVHLRHKESQLVLEAVPATVGHTLKMKAAKKGDGAQLWTMAWNGCLENQRTKMVIAAQEDGSLELEKGQLGERSQWWRIESGGNFKNVAYDEALNFQTGDPSSLVSIDTRADSWEFVEIGK